MLQNAFDALRSNGDIIIDFRFSLLVIGLAYFVRKFIQRRRENAVSHAYLTYIENTNDKPDCYRRKIYSASGRAVGP